MKTITVELTEHEAAALMSTANLLAEALAAQTLPPEVEGVPPLVTGAMRIETALIAEGVSV